MRISLGWGLVFLLFASSCHGQAAGSSGPLQTTSGTGFTGAPYSGKETTVTVRTLSDGTQTTQVFETLLWRDNKGRTRQEMIRRNNSGGEFHSIVVTDSVTCVYRKWETGDTSAKRAVSIWPVDIRQCVTAPAARPYAGIPSRPAMTEPPGSQTADQTIVIYRYPVIEQSPANSGVQHEKLTSQFINGVWAEGSRTVRSIPIDQEKNGRVVQVLNELWISPELKIIVRHIMDDPRTGRTATDVTDIAFGDPDPALFEPPPNYPVVDHR